MQGTRRPGRGRWPIRAAHDRTVGLGGPWRRGAAGATAGAGLFELSWLLLEDPRDVVPAWEVEVFEALNGLPDSLRWPLWGPMQLGNFWMCAAGASGVYAATRRASSALATAAAVVLAWGAAKGVKRVIERGRPGDLLTGVEVREAGIHGQGYVSGHAAVAFAVATVVAPLLPRAWRWAPLGLATVVALTRVYYGAHLPLDVVGGAGLGVVCGVVAAALAEQLDDVPRVRHP
jgi:membrane-associated phospholipid phosphatase